MVAIVQWRAGIDPELPPRILRSGRSPKSAISELGFYEADAHCQVQRVAGVGLHCCRSLKSGQQW